jgi:hypothetical protein
MVERQRIRRHPSQATEHGKGFLFHVRVPLRRPGNYHAKP